MQLWKTQFPNWLGFYLFFPSDGMGEETDLGHKAHRFCFCWMWVDARSSSSKKILFQPRKGQVPSSWPPSPMWTPTPILVEIWTWVPYGLRNFSKPFPSHWKGKQRKERQPSLSFEPKNIHTPHYKPSNLDSWMTLSKYEKPKFSFDLNKFITEYNKNTHL